MKSRSFHSNKICSFWNISMIFFKLCWLDILFQNIPSLLLSGEESDFSIIDFLSFSIRIRMILKNHSYKFINIVPRLHLLRELQHVLLDFLSSLTFPGQLYVYRVVIFNIYLQVVVTPLISEIFSLKYSIKKWNIFCSWI